MTSDLLSGKWRLRPGQVTVKLKNAEQPYWIYAEGQEDKYTSYVVELSIRVTY